MIWPFRRGEQTASDAQYDETERILAWVQQTLGEDWYAQAGAPRPERGDERLERVCAYSPQLSGHSVSRAACLAE
jgi:hypothetical protein